MEKTQIILASQSIGRKTLLEKLGVPFEVMSSDIQEDSIIGIDVYKTLELRARAKAENVAERLTANSLQTTAHRQQLIDQSSQITAHSFQNDKSTMNYELRTKNYLVIAADSEAILNGKTYGKSRNKTHSEEILRALMGKTHEFVTATSIFHLKYLKSLRSLTIQNRWHNITKTLVTLRHLSPGSLSLYLTRYDFSRFAAAYTLNETPWDLVTKIDGSYTNVIGLPFEVLLPIFELLMLLK